MNESAWKFFACMYDDETWPDPDPRACVNACWPNVDSAVSGLFDAYSEIFEAENNDEVYPQLEKMSYEHFEVGALFIRDHLPIARSLLIQGQLVHGGAAVDFLIQKLETGNSGSRQYAALMLGELGSKASKASVVLATVLGGKPDQSVEYVRRAAALALGKIGEASDDVVQVLTQVVGDTNESQCLRSYSIEALMDLGPDASASTSVLEQVFRNDEDDDLRHFAWAALKSVTASEKDHACGGTVADHYRSTDPADE